MGFQLSRLSFRLRTTVNGHSARVYTTVGAGGGRGERGEGERERSSPLGTLLLRFIQKHSCAYARREELEGWRREEIYWPGGNTSHCSFFFFFFSLFSLLIVSFPPDRCAPRSFCVILFCFSLCRQSRAEETSVEHEGKNGGGSRKRPLCLVKRERKIFRARFVRVKPLP